jgi:ADP-heptose:LPS heptosyltransferase
MLGLLAPLNVPAIADMRLYAPAEAMDWWREHRKTMGVADGAPVAVIAPGSRWLSKRWPIERFTEVIEPVLKRGFARVIVIGSNAERDQMPSLLNLAPKSGGTIVDLVGKTSIAQTLAIIADAGLVIANDSAPLHMAVGFDRPCIALFGPTDPAAVGPYARAECVVRAYQPHSSESIAYKDPRLGDSLMRLISTTLVLQSIDRVLALWPRRSRQVQADTAMNSHANAGRHASASAEFVTMPHGLNPKAAS